MANIVNKHSISYELAQKMADAAVAKARELGVTENVAILDDGGKISGRNVSRVLRGNEGRSLTLP